MLYIDRIDKDNDKVYLYDTDLEVMSIVSSKTLKIRRCDNYTELPNSELGFYDDVLKVPTSSMLLYNTKDASALVQTQGGNRILYVYANGYMYEIALAGATICINYEMQLSLRSGSSDIEFRYMYPYKGSKNYGITLVNKRTLDIYQLKFDDKGNIYSNESIVCKGTKITKNTFRRTTLLTA